MLIHLRNAKIAQHGPVALRDAITTTVLLLATLTSRRGLGVKCGGA